MNAFAGAEKSQLLIACPRPVIFSEAIHHQTPPALPQQHQSQHPIICQSLQQRLTNGTSNGGAIPISNNRSEHHEQQQSSQGAGLLLELDNTDDGSSLSPRPHSVTDGQDGQPSAKKRRPNGGKPAVPVRPQCVECGKDFSNQSALSKHKLTHSDERRFSCALCGKAFKRQVIRSVPRFRAGAFLAAFLTHSAVSRLFATGPSQWSHAHASRQKALRV